MASAHASVHVLDEDGRPVTAGEQGEIFCSGHSVALGYLNDEAGTKRSFRPSSSLDRRIDFKSSIVYATGDYGSVNDRGELLLTGRRDAQIKINGQRVDLREINNILAGEGIEHHVVGKKDRSSGRARIYAFLSREKVYSRQDITTLHEASLSKRLFLKCRAFLPAYMIPKLVVVSAIPLNLAGKIDERALLGLVENHRHVARGPAMTYATDKLSCEELHEILASMVANQISGNVPDVDDDLIAYGLTSLDFMFFIKNVSNSFSVSLRLRELFENATVRGISQLLWNKLRNSTSAQKETTTDGGVIGPFTDDRATPEGSSKVDVTLEQTQRRIISPAQWLIFTAHAVLRNHAYNCNFLLDIDSYPLDADRLVHALKAVCSRHEILRSTYREEPREFLASENDAALAGCHQVVHSLDALPPSSQVHVWDKSFSGSDGLAMKYIEEDARRPFDLAHDSPVRIAIHQLSATKNKWIIHFNIHHIAIDEWAFENILCPELECSYHASEIHLDNPAPSSGASLLESVSKPFSSTPQYHEFTTGQWAEWSQSQEDIMAKKDWWLHKMDFETTEPLVFPQTQAHTPWNGPKKPKKDESSLHTFELDARQVRIFETAVCRRSTAFIGWFSLCQILLSRITGRSKFSIAIPITLRDLDPRYQEIMGFCLNTIPFPVKLEVEDTFAAVLSSVQRTFDECIAKAMPLHSLHQILDAEAPSNRCTRLPQVMFVYHESHTSDLHAEENKNRRFLQQAEQRHLASVGSRFDLVIHIAHHQMDRTHVILEYRETLFDASFIETMDRSLNVALSDVNSSGFGIAHSQIQCLSPVDERTIINWSLPTPLSMPMERLWIMEGNGVSLHHLVLSKAQQHLHTNAIESSSGESVTYENLIQRAWAFMEALQVMGLVESGTVVMLLPPSVELIIARLAVLMGGGNFVSLDPLHKLSLIQSKLNVAGASILLHDQTTASSVHSLEIGKETQIMNICELTIGRRASSEMTLKETHVQIDAYRGFTSGSTGDAKYFAVSHAAAAVSIMSHIERFEVGPGDRVGMVCSTTFDVSVLETFVALASGATLCIASRDEVLGNLGGTLHHLSTTHIFATPTLISLIEDPSQVPSLRFVTFLGEPITQALFERWIGRVVMHNAYGPAEVALNTHSRRFSETDDVLRMGQWIGDPMPSIVSYVLDANGNLTIPGCIGRLHIGERVAGKIGHLSRGYIWPRHANDRYIYHKRFGKLYNTGDLCFHAADGALNLIGRDDDQIKLHGILVNRGDVERTLQNLTPNSVAITICDEVIAGASVSEPAVFLFMENRVYEKSATMERLCPWLQSLDREISKQLHQIRSEASYKILENVLPKYWLPINALPVNNSNKLDRVVLKAWALEVLAHETIKLAYSTLTSPGHNIEEVENMCRTSLGSALVETWQIVFRVPRERIEVNTPFIYVGADSISAIRFVSCLRSKGVQGCSVSLLYDSPSLQSLYASLASIQIQDADGALTRTMQKSSHSAPPANSLPVFSIAAKVIGVPRDLVAKLYSTTSMQQAMWLQYEVDPEIYVTQVVLRLEGRVDHRLMSSAWASTCNAHPILRTTFTRIPQNGRSLLMAVELKDQTLTEFSVEPPHLGFQSLEKLLEKERAKGFRLGGPMVRLTLRQASDRDYDLALTCHHISCDGWSLDIILQSLVSSFRGTIPNPTPSCSAVVEHDAGRDKTLAQSYWATYLQGYAHSPLSWSLSPRAMESGLDMTFMRRRLPSVSPQTLADFVQRHGITAAVIFQGAWAFVISHFTGSEDVAFGVVVSGRNVPVMRIDEIAGNILNTIPLRIRIDRQQDCTAWLKDIHRSSIQSLQHDHLSLADIAQVSPPMTELMETVLIFENHAQQLEKNAFGRNVFLRSIESREFSGIPLSTVLEWIDDQLVITFKFDRTRFSELQVASIMDSYIAVLGDTLTGVECSRLGRSRSYDTLIMAQNSLSVLDSDVPMTSTLVSAFDVAAQDHRDRIAIEDESGHISFEELLRQSDMVGGFLSHAGVGPGFYVPILMEQSVNMTVAMLGIMKAGAAYCPIDVDSPDQRLSYILEKTAATVVIGTELYRRRIQRWLGNDRQFISVDGIVTRDDIERCIISHPVAPHHACYVLFTSGTTGVPKGCVLSHHAVVNAVEQTREKTKLDCHARVLLFANYTFDASVMDIFGSLFSGARLFIPSRSRMLSNLNSVVNQYRISHIHLTPTTVRMLDPDSCSTLKTMVVGGERMTTTLRDRWAMKLSLYDGYGPTECAIQVSTSLVTPTCEVGVVSSPLPGNSIVLLDANSCVPRKGEIGEICVSGRQLFSGYLGDRQGLDSHDTYTKSCQDLPKALFYATGDMGRYDEDMSIRLLGRKDNQTKLSGERIEVEEIESIILASEIALQCMVLVDRNRLCAILTCPSSISPEDAGRRIRDWCLNKLPPRFFPIILVWESLPTTSSGKLDRRAALHKFKELENPSITPIPDTIASDVEKVIVDMILEISGVELKDASLPFQHAGLNSLDILHLRSRLSEKYQCTLEISQFWLGASIGSLAEQIVSTELAHIASEDPADLSNGGSIPASDPQFTMWMAQESLRDGTYNVCNIIKMQKVDAARMHRSVEVVTRSIDLFTITFHWDNSTQSLHQRKNPELHVPVDLMKVDWDQEGAVSSTKKILSHDMEQAFDLETGPLAKFWIIGSTSDQHCFLYYNIHHILVDEWTCDMLIHSFLQECSGLSWREGFTSSWQQQSAVWHVEPRKEESLSAWKKRLSGATPFDTRSWPKGTCNRGDSAAATTPSVPVPPKTLRDIREVVKHVHNIDLFNTLLSVFQLLLHQ
jgi:amino acid adenylation domain-containing protein